MKFSAAVLTGALATLAQCADVEVYRFPFRSTSNRAHVPKLSQNDAILNLANQLDISGNYELDQLQDLESLGLGQDSLFTEDGARRQKLVLIVQGAPSGELLADETPLFTVGNDGDHQELQKFLANLPNEFESSSQLSDSIQLVQPKRSDSHLKQLWDHYFQISSKYNDKLHDIWTDLKSAFHLEQGSQDSGIELINDESFINEMSQFKFLVEDAKVESEKVIANLKSLSTILKKTGQDSKTYQNSIRILSSLISKNLIENINNRFDTTIVVIPSQEETFAFQANPQVQHLHKRSTGAVSSSSGCYTSEESCLISTSSCSNHGVCSKTGDCWACSCAASYNETTKSTTYWQGSNCSKKDVSVEFNLFLWFTVFMAIATVSGIKLMYNVGNEELPGVLSAATAAKRSNA